MAKHCNAFKTKDGGTGFMCGNIHLERCKACGYLASSLCDYPIGKGKTCDIPMCDEHKNNIGNDLHLCKFHISMWTEKLKDKNLSIFKKN